MTPQLQQAIKLLQYNHLEMIDALQQELKENPLLEVLPLDEPLNNKEADNRNDLNDLEEMAKEPELPGPDPFDVDWENYLESYGADYSPRQRDYSERPPLENMVTYSHNLFRHLLEQLQLSRLEETDRRIALQIIGNLNESGYLEIEIQELAKSLEVEVSRVEQVLTVVQEFDPAGVAARNLRECLLNQARALYSPESLVVRILDEAFDLVERGKYDGLARKFKEPMETVQAALKSISSLDPSPGRQFSNSDTVYVVPDIFVVKVGSDYSVILNDDGLPRLRVSSFYQKQLHANASSAIAKDYIQEKMRGAMWLIKSIHQRQRTIHKVTQSIIKFQRDFFDRGIDYLKPLILKDVADDIEMHESTISRVTTNKYIHTPRGTFELKFFFNSGIPQGLESIASEAVKNQILRIVKNENPKKPVSDKQIADQLAKTQIHIARRTVAKYREMLGIPPSSKRKKKF